MLIVFGIVQVGFVIWSNSTLAFAVDSAVRYASLNGARSSTPATADSIRTMVRNAATGLKKNDITVNVTWTPNNRPGSVVRVQAIYPVPTLVDIVWKHPFPLRSSTQLVILN